LLYAGIGLSFQSLKPYNVTSIEKSEKLPNQQETFNKGSSETNTQSSFTFTNIGVLPQQIKKYDSSFLT
jgi:hypothetical protein